MDEWHIGSLHVAFVCLFLFFFGGGGGGEGEGNYRLYFYRKWFTSVQNTVMLA